MVTPQIIPPSHSGLGASPHIRTQTRAEIGSSIAALDRPLRMSAEILAAPADEDDDEEDD